MNKQAEREKLYSLLGDLPPRDRPISARTLSHEERDGYTLEKLMLDLNGVEEVPAYFVKPAGGAPKPPVVLFCHSHGGYYFLGKDELIKGNTYMYTPPYAEALTKQGYAALCIDYWLFGERSGRDETELFKEMLWNGQVLWGMMVYDQLRAIDYLQTRGDVDAGRLASLGMSMGSTMSWWLAALDERIKVCVDICCLTDFRTLIEKKGLNGHGIFYYVPSLLKYFGTADINALIAPRPHLAVAGIYDLLTPEEGLDRVDLALKNAYAAENAADAWKLTKYPVAHQETAGMREEVLEFLEKWL
ncbi:MAG: dienelactone hydrolase family protein [Defluviitaleaceae bacterium]|nr:dienelactone hydrolase family protein [Defluviitaleaceae bacterium]